MKILRFPLTDSTGAITPQAQSAMGEINGQCGRSFQISFAAADGTATTSEVSLCGDLCFIPAAVPEHAVAEITRRLAPLLEAPEEASRRFFLEVLDIPAPSPSRYILAGFKEGAWTELDATGVQEGENSEDAVAFLDGQKFHLRAFHAAKGFKETKIFSESEFAALATRHVSSASESGGREPASSGEESCNDADPESVKI